MILVFSLLAPRCWVLARISIPTSFRECWAGRKGGEFKSISVCDWPAKQSSTERTYRKKKNATSVCSAERAHRGRKRDGREGEGPMFRMLSTTLFRTSPASGPKGNAYGVGKPSAFFRFLGGRNRTIGCSGYVRFQQGAAHIAGYRSFEKETPQKRPTTGG